VFAAACFIVVPAILVSSQAMAAEGGNYKFYLVKEAFTGDTLRLESGSLLRYASVKAPDLDHERKSVRRYAEESKQYNHRLAAGKEVRVEWGHQLRDLQGNYQGFVFLRDGTMLNLKAIQDGYVKLLIEPPNIQYADELRSASRAARRESRGLWEYEATEERPPQVFIGDQMTRRLHFPTCEALEDVPRGHWIEFDSRLQALRKKYKLCEKCRSSYSENTDLF